MSPVWSHSRTVCRAFVLRAIQNLQSLWGGLKRDESRKHGAKSHVPSQQTCRRHSRLTLQAGLITVSDSQTAPRTLKMPVWNLCVFELTIIPSILQESKAWRLVKWVDGELFADCDPLMCSKKKKRGRARFSNEGRSTTYCPTVYSRLPWDGPEVSLEVRTTSNAARDTKEEERLVWSGYVHYLILDRRPLSPATVTTSKPTLRPPSLTSSV